MVQLMLTKNNFRQLNEADLRKEILIPLFRAMGYKDVYEYHGGAGEQGKDIVCWKLDELGSRENLALVVKATQMTGKAQVNKGTAGEVQTQIRQCFGSPYIDPVSGDDQSVHRVWVVSNKKISKESINAIKSAVANPDLMRNVRFIDGDTLWGLIETHLPLSMWHFIEETRKRVGTSDSHYEPQIQITGDRTSVTLVEKFPGASEEKPITINTKFHFPSKKDAEMFEASFKKHLETGEPLDIPSDIIGVAHET
jgi:hypothetical protein